MSEYQVITLDCGCDVFDGIGERAHQDWVDVAQSGVPLTLEFGEHPAGETADTGRPYEAQSYAMTGHDYRPRMMAFAPTRSELEEWLQRHGVTWVEAETEIDA